MMMEEDVTTKVTEAKDIDDNESDDSDEKPVNQQRHPTMKEQDDEE